MTIPGLLKSQVAELGRAVAKSGFVLADFSTGPVNGEFCGAPRVPGFIHDASSASFAFGRYMRAYGYGEELVDEGHSVGFSPGSEKPFEQRGPLEWAEVSKAFSDWLKYLKRELNAPDIWQSFSDEASAALGDTSNEDVPFDTEAQSHITSKLSDIEQQLAEVARQTTATDGFVRKEFAELREELAKMQRGKWKKMFLGTLASMAARHIVPDSALQTALHSAEDFFGNTLPHLLNRGL